MIPLFKVNMATEVAGDVARVLDSGFIGQGPEVEKFEAELGEFTRYPVVSTNSCTSAIHAVLMHLGVGPGDEVITTPLTCVASVAPVLAVGARPIWADVDPLTGNIDPADVEAKITERTKAIIAVDWTGRAPDYVMLRSFGIPVIEDAAHGPLIYGDREVGDFVCFSFGPIKHLTCGDGGAIMCERASARGALRLLRWYGLDRTSSKDFRCAQDIERAGLKFHMNDINASIGRANLPALQETVLTHRRNAYALWRRLLPLCTWLTMAPYDANSNYWVFPVLTSSRDALKAHLEANGVAASQVHSRIDRHTAYQFPNGPLPGLDEYDSRHLNIPCGWWLTESNIDDIVAAFASFEP